MFVCVLTRYMICGCTHKSASNHKPQAKPPRTIPNLAACKPGIMNASIAGIFERENVAFAVWFEVNCYYHCYDDDYYCYCYLLQLLVLPLPL